MDLSSAKFNKIENNNLSFEGKKNIKNSKGQEVTRFYTPYIELKDDEKLGIEFIPFDKNGTSYTPSKIISPIRYQANSQDFKDFENGKVNYVDTDIQGLKRWKEYGYRFVVYDKNDKPVRYFTDNVGTVVERNEGEKFTVASTRQGSPLTRGSMYHAFTDSYNIAKEARESFVRNHFNKAGGNINSLTNIINNSDGELDQYEYIMTTPIVGGDKSSHGYHPENLFHITRGMGSVEDFKNMQLACFNNGKRYIVDGAFTSQGYQALQLNYSMKWGEQSPFKYWYKNPGNDGYGIGVLSDKSEINKKYTGIRIVNPKNDPHYKYNPEMPTYIQFYDTRLASPAQLANKGKLIEKYDINDAKDPYEITTWHDGTIQNWFEINPNTKLPDNKSFASLQEWQDAGLLNDILNPEGESYSYVRRGQVAGTTGWDGNIDLVKLNESNHVNSPLYEEGKNQVRNQIFNVGKYWTELTRDTLIKDISSNIHSIKNNGKAIVNGREYTNINDYLHSIEENYSLVKGSLTKIAKNIEDYKCNITRNETKAPEAIQESILNFPLESLDYSNELLGVLSTPYITPRPSAKTNPAASKAEILKDARNNTKAPLSKTMNELYTETLPYIIRNILYEIQSSSEPDKKLFNANGNDLGELTDYGKYFLQMMMPEFMQFIITESLFGDKMSLPYKDGQIDFDALRQDFDKNGNKMNLKKLRIFESTPEREAEAVAKKIKKGINNIDEKKIREFKNYLANKYTSTTVSEYKLADAIVDQTGSGLNWRFDAAKDIADWEEVKSGKISSEQAWDDVISFWKPFVRNVRQANPSSYIVAEVTSLGDFNPYDWGKYENADKAERTYYEETGATTGSNYSTFFGAYPKLFGKNIEEGDIDNYGNIDNFINNAKNFCLPGDNGHSSSEFILGSHVFLDNHDKPRAAHLMGVDAKLFWGDFKKNKDKVKAEKLLKRPYNDNMSSKATAVAEQYYNYFEEEGKKLGLKEDDIKALKNAITHLANGYQYGTKETKPDFTKAEAFGNMPFEITIPHVIEQAKLYGLNLSSTDKKNLENLVFHDMVAPYESKMASIYELMVGTVGIPTLFAGDELAQTGCETKSKNWALGCRNPVRHDWVKSKGHVRTFNQHIKQAGLLGKHEGMGSLTGGTPIFINATSKEGPSINEILSRETILDAVNKVFENNMQWDRSFENTRNLCGFLDCYKDINLDLLKEKEEKEVEKFIKITKEEAIPTLENMDESKLVKDFAKHIKSQNMGFLNWALDTYSPQAGAVVKYNDKGENVITVLTNTFMNRTATVGALNDSNDNAFNVAEINLKDANGNLIAKPETKFQRLAYSPIENKYVKDGVYKYNKDGRLVPLEGADEKLKSTVTYFYKIK